MRFAVWRKLDGSGFQGRILLCLRLSAGGFYVVIIRDDGEARGRPTRVAGGGAITRRQALETTFPAGYI